MIFGFAIDTQIENIPMSVYDLDGRQQSREIVEAFVNTKRFKVVERVQLPKDHVLVGFGPRNVVYLTKAEGKATYLERALLKGPPK